MIEAKDLTGQRFNKLTVTRPTERRSATSIVWECRCDCGNMTFVSGSNLRSGNTKSCGCLKKAALSGRALDITGQRFGRLTAIRPTEKRRENGSVVWECRCDCGNTVFVGAGSLRSGNTKSCGCSVSVGIKDQQIFRAGE